MSLSFNRRNPLFLASGSADTKVKIWDINSEQCVSTLSFHTDKVQVVQWCPTKDDLLLTAGFDSVANLITPGDEKSKVSTKLRKNLERAKWHIGEENLINFTFEDGFVQIFDI